MAINLLVFGAPRSGTSLLAAMLGAHPDVAMAHEDTGDGWTRVVGKRVQGVKLVTPHQIEHTHALPERLRRARRRIRRYGLQNWGIGWPRFKMRSVFTIRDFQTWPDARLLAVLRDPQDGIESIQQRGTHLYGEAEYRWARALEAIETVRTETPDRLHVIYYDNLVRDPETTMRRCLAWLDLPYDSRVIQGETVNYGAGGIDPAKAGDRGDAARRHPVFDKRPDLAAAFTALTRGTD